MARRNKRASMREGPLSDLFRSTSEDAPMDPPEAPRYGREDPAEAKGRQDEGDRPAGPVAAGDPPSPPVAKASSEMAPPTAPPAGEAASADVPLTQEEAPTLYDQEEIEGSTESAPERLKRVFNEEPLPRRQQFSTENPRYGREEPAYEPPGSGEPHQPVIKVVGVGGAGVNAVNRMVDARIPGVEFMAVNTDLQSLQVCTADVTVHIGGELTRGLGSGCDPELGYQAAFEEQDKIKRLLKGSDMVFVAAGAGGGTGTGAAPVIARLAREVGALTVGIVTRPFSFEGSRRAKQAEKGIETLGAEVDTVIVVPNDRLLSVLDEKTSMVDAFEVADDVLRQGVQGISDLVTLPALINLDFADVRTIMSDAGQALLGIGMSSGGEGRAVAAAEKAISSPLLDTSVEGARSILLSITGGPDLSLVEVSEAAKVVGEHAHQEANIIFGASIDEELSDQIWVTVVATRFDGRMRPRRQAEEPTIRRTGRGRPRERPAEFGGVEVPEFLPG
jgi:cell division protein FtsZ